MKLKYLGTAAAEGIPAMFCECETCKKARMSGGKNIRTRSQAIVDDKILIDFPADTYMHFLTNNLCLSKIKTCIITHSHSDHLYPNDIELRAKGYAHIADKDTPITFYSDESGYKKINDSLKIPTPNEVRTVLIKPFKSFNAEGYMITPIRATHDPESTPLLYIIEKDGKSLFYSNDTGEYKKETMEFLKNRKTPFSLVSLDCTLGCGYDDLYCHLSLDRCVAIKDTFLKENIADKNTIFVLNHFSHNGKNILHDELNATAKEYGFLASYDGMEIEVI